MYLYFNKTGPNFIIKDLPSVLVVFFLCGQTPFILLVIGELGSRPFPSHLTNKLGNVVMLVSNLPSVLILIIADQILNDSMCCSNKYNCLCRFIGKLYILL